MKGNKRLVEIALFGMLGAVLTVSQVALSFLPNIELVSMLIIAYTIVYGAKAFYPVYVFIIMMGIIWGFSYFWIFYLYVWALLVLITLALRKHSSLALWVTVSGIYGLLFGALYAIMFIFAGGPPLVFTTWVAGIKFDILHCIGNTAAAFLVLPVVKVLKRLSEKAGLIK